MEIFSYSLLEEQTFHDVTSRRTKGNEETDSRLLIRGQEENTYISLSLWKGKQRDIESPSGPARWLG